MRTKLTLKMTFSAIYVNLTIIVLCRMFN